MVCDWSVVDWIENVICEVLVTNRQIIMLLVRKG